MLLSIGFNALFNKCNSIQLILEPCYKHLKNAKLPKHHNKTLVWVWLSFCLVFLLSCCFLSRHHSDQMSQASKSLFVSKIQKCRPLRDSERVGIELPGQLRLVTLFVGINYHYIYSIINMNQLSLQKIFRSLCWVGFLIISTISWCFLTGRFVASFAFHQTVILHLLWCFLLGFQKPVRNQYVTRCVLSEPSV